MAKILLINPNKWGRGITHIWIASHSAVLKGRGHEVQLFDAAFFADWAINEIHFNTENKQYKPSNYDQKISYVKTPILEALQARIDEYRPDFIFWSALSSHIHGEGEYVNIQYGHTLLKGIRTTAVKVAAGLQPTADGDSMFEHFPEADYFIRGESEFVLSELIDVLSAGDSPEPVKGLVHKNSVGEILNNAVQPIISDMDAIPPYDYSLFEDQVFWRPYNGEVVRAVDYELSRGCIYACEYCVETVIQRYYGFIEIVADKGTLQRPKSYLRHKSAKRIFQEMSDLYNNKGVRLFRCQDTNFLTIDRSTLVALADMISESGMDIMLYIETRPEGINPSTIKLLKKLKVDGVGMGVELSTQEFREEKLRRYADQQKIVDAFRQLREAGIRRTAYNIIGLPDQDESSILETIRFNSSLDPDNVTIAFYSPYIGTSQQRKANELGYFDDYEYHVDSTFRSLSKHSLVEVPVLNFYKKHFNQLVQTGLTDLNRLKIEAGLVINE
jgi:anaerobic magnesium-protoporphyrin IX monomethyl ester cyclase